MEFIKFKNTEKTYKNGVKYAKEKGYNYVIIDTAGRLQY